MIHPYLYRHRRSIHLTDRPVASSARGCDTADSGVCPAHWHIHTHMYIYYRSLKMPPPLRLTSGEGSNLICVRSLGGHGRNDWWGPFHLSWSCLCNPVALTCGVKIVKPQNVQLLGLQGISGASRPICIHWWLNMFGCLCACLHCMCHSLSYNIQTVLERMRPRFSVLDHVAIKVYL